MKRILTWVEEERILLLLILIGVGLILKTLPDLVLFGGMLIYGAVILAVLSAVHKLYSKFKK
ncbi:MAG: hypothetical protein AAB740_03710 [Patescibacteria group bacterium]